MRARPGTARPVGARGAGRAHRLAPLALAGWALVVSGAPATAGAPPAVAAPSAPVAPAVSPALLRAVEARFEHGFERATREQDNETLAEMQRVYAGFGFEPLWVTDAGVSPRGRELAQAIRALRLDGLEPEDYRASRIERLLGASDRAELGELEVRLSLALVTAASDLASGRLHPRTVNPDLYIYPQDVDKPAVLQGARERADVAGYLHSFEPSQANYHRLKAALAEYRALAALPDGAPIPRGETLGRGAIGPRISALRARLERLGDLPRPAPGTEPPRERFDAGLEQAVKRFQTRHGLDPDGRVGRRTLTALNVPLEARVDQILLNLERRRWMPDSFENRYVFVNLADYQLKVVERIDDRERTLMTTEVVVGEPYHQTPEFSHQIQYLVLNPYWNVPVSIARDELLPKIKADPGYLAANGYELLESWSPGAPLVDPASVRWSAVTPSAFRYKIRQIPGPENALGRIKFVFPNPYNIYLHDTPARTLFKHTQRAFSHGCIRVKDPERLADVLLKWQNDWPPERLHRAIDAGERTIVALASPVPIHLAYITAWVNKDGTVNFRDDVYGRDDALARALFPPEMTRKSSSRG